ncbi:MAG: cytochrome C [Nitrospirae bacterium]|nr:cytochrome C [Nitrospirota bacterium]
MILVFIVPFGAMWGGRFLEHSPSFCISCHEMQPSYDGWIASGASKHHPDCIQCHSGPGLQGVLESEWRGLHFLKVHYFGHRKANQPFRVKMPEEFCLQCHSAGKLMEAHRPFQTGGHTCADCHKHNPGWKFKGELHP